MTTPFHIGTSRRISPLLPTHPSPERSTHLYREPRRILLPRLPRRLESAIRQSAQTLGGRRTGGDKGDVVAEGSHEGGRLVVVGVFEGDGVGDELWGLGGEK